MSSSAEGRRWSARSEGQEVVLAAGRARGLAPQEPPAPRSAWACRDARQGFAGAGPCPPLTRLASRTKSVRIDLSRLAPPIEVGPAPCHSARAEMHRRRKRAAGDKTVDGGATEARRLDHRGQAREQAGRLGDAGGDSFEVLHGEGRRCGSTVGQAVAPRANEIQRKIIAALPLMAGSRSNACACWKRPREPERSCVDEACSRNRTREPCRRQWVEANRVASHHSRSVCPMRLVDQAVACSR